MKTKVTKKEFAWYVIAGILVFIGLTLIIFDIIGDKMRSSSGRKLIWTGEPGALYSFCLVH